MLLPQHRTTPEEVADAVKQRGEELNTLLLEKRANHTIQIEVGDQRVDIPERWLSTTFDELLAFYMRANDPRTADTMPDSGWGLLDEANHCFSHDGRTLTDADFDMLRSLAKEHEDIHTLSLAELCKRFYEKQAATERVKLQTRRIRGKE